MNRGQVIINRHNNNFHIVNKLLESRVKVMLKNNKFLILLISLVLLSGCININVTPEKSEQSTPAATSSYFKTPKNIDTSKLDIAKVVLNDNEIKEVIGPDWSKKENSIRATPENIQVIISAFEKQNTYYKLPPTASLIMYILPNTTATDEIYNKFLTEIFKESTDYKIGDSGKIIKINETIRTNEATAVMFKINTIIVIAMTSLDQDTTINLAKKQESKIKEIISKI